MTEERLERFALAAGFAYAEDQRLKQKTFYAGAEQLSRFALFVAAFDRHGVERSCSACENFIMGECRHHGMVPDDFLTQPNDCGDWSFDQVPF